MPRAYACIKQYQSTPPLVDGDRFVAVHLQWNAKKIPKCEKIFSSKRPDAWTT